MKLDLYDVLISSYNEGGDTAANLMPLESLSLNFVKIEFGVAGPPNLQLPVARRPWEVTARRSSLGAIVVGGRQGGRRESPSAGRPATEEQRGKPCHA